MKFHHQREPAINGKSAYNGMLRRKLEDAIQGDDPARFTMDDGFKTTSKGAKRTCYPKCVHKRTHSVFYYTADHKLNTELSMTWNVKCDDCAQLLRSDGAASPFPLAPAVNASAPGFNEGASTSFTASSAETPALVGSNDLKFISILREHVNNKLNDFERELKSSEDPLKVLVANEARMALEVAQAFQMGVASARIFAPQQPLARLLLAPESLVAARNHESEPVEPVESESFAVTTSVRVTEQPQTTEAESIADAARDPEPPRAPQIEFDNQQFREVEFINMTAEEARGIGVEVEVELCDNLECSLSDTERSAVLAAANAVRPRRERTKSFKAQALFERARAQMALKTKGKKRSANDAV